MAPAQIYEVVEPITVTPEYTGVDDTSTLQFTITGGKGAGNPANYTLAVDPTPVGVINATTGVFTPSAGGGVRTFKITAADKTYTGISAQSVTVTVVDPIMVTPEAEFIQASGTMTVGVSGGSGSITWSVEPSTAGSMDGDSLFTAGAVTENVAAVITATDAAYANVTGTADVMVYSKVTITNKPEEPPVIQPGEDSEEFTVAGGDDDEYVWSVVGPDGYSAEEEGTSYTFTAPSDECAFAGEYTITVTDGQGFTDSFTVLVPMTLDPNHYNLVEGDDPLEIHILGAPEGTGFSFTGYDLNGNEVVFSEDGGDVTGWGQLTLDGNVLTYVSDDIETADEIAFTLEVIADQIPIGGADLIGLDLDLVESGTYRVIPIGTYAGVIKDADTDAPIEGARVKLIAPMPEPVMVTGSGKLPMGIDLYSQYTDENGIFEFELPATGANYLFMVSMDDYVSKIFTSADLEENSDVTISAVADGMSISGTVEPAGETRVMLFNGDGGIIGIFETAGDGLFEFDFAADSGEEYILTGVQDVVDGELYGEVTASVGDTTVNIELTTIITQDDSVEYAPNDDIYGSEFLCQITAEDGSGPVTDFPNGLIVTIDFDLGKVAPGDFESGVAAVYHAVDEATLLAGNGTMVPVEDILAVDYIGDGQTGYVTFRVYSLSVFGIGAGSGSDALSDHSDDSSCFISSVAGGFGMNPPVAVLGLAGLFAASLLLTGRKCN